LFWDIPDFKPVWLSGAILQREITANSTCREVKAGKDGLVDGKGFRKVIEARFSCNKNNSSGLF
jgi:hypothetical protein